MWGAQVLDRAGRMDETSSVVPLTATLSSKPINVSVVMRQMIMGEGAVMVVFVFYEVVGGGGDLGVQSIVADVNDPITVLWKQSQNCTRY